VAELGQAQEGAAGLLIEVKGESEQQLQQVVEAAQQALRASGVRFGGQAGAPLGLESYPFRVNPAVSFQCRCLLFPNMLRSRGSHRQQAARDDSTSSSHLAAVVRMLHCVRNQAFVCVCCPWQVQLCAEQERESGIVFGGAYSVCACSALRLLCGVALRRRPRCSGISARASSQSLEAAGARGSPSVR
jgi:hypothetical protein